MRSYKELLFYFPNAKSLASIPELFAIKIVHPEVHYESWMKVFLRGDRMAL